MNDTKLSLSAKVAGLWLFVTLAALLSLAACDSGGLGHKLPAIDFILVALVGTVRKPFRLQPQV